MPTPIGIQTNISALHVQRHLASTSQQLNASVNRLSSGYRIQSSADDAAGMAVSEGLRATIRGAVQARRNANDAVAVLRTAEGAFETITELLIRMRELAVQGANDTLTDQDRGYIDTEYQLLIDEMERVSNVTEYNGVRLLDGTAGDGSGMLTFQVGVRNTENDRLEFTIPTQSPLALGVSFTGTDSLENSQLALDALDFALTSLATDRAALGSMMNRLEVAIDNMSITHENLTAAMSQIKDVDVTTENTNLVGKQVLMQAGVSMLTQASQLPNLALQLLQG